MFKYKNSKYEKLASFFSFVVLLTFQNRFIHRTIKLGLAEHFSEQFGHNSCDAFVKINSRTKRWKKAPSSIVNTGTHLFPSHFTVRFLLVEYIKKRQLVIRKTNDLYGCHFFATDTCYCYNSVVLLYRTPSTVPITIIVKRLSAARIPLSLASHENEKLTTNPVFCSHTHCTHIYIYICPNTAFSCLRVPPPTYSQQNSYRTSLRITLDATAALPAWQQLICWHKLDIKK